MTNPGFHGAEDRPRLFNDRAALEARLEQLDATHVAPLNAWVASLRDRLGPAAIVPYFDPRDAGVDARILWLLEAPGPRATRERGGSGIVSCNNNDGTAANTWTTRHEAGVPRSMVVHWNAIPYYLGSDTRIRAHNTADVASAGPLLAELLELLPRIRAVILGGKAAQRTWAGHAPKETAVSSFEAPHPSPTNLNTRPLTREAVVKAWRDAMAAATRS